MAIADSNARITVTLRKETKKKLVEEARKNHRTPSKQLEYQLEQIWPELLSENDSGSE